MKLTLDWLQNYVDLGGLAPEKLADHLTMLGLEVDAVTPLYDELAPLRTGLVVAAEKHPDAVNTFTVKRSNAPAGRVHLYFALGDEQEAPAQLTKAATGWGDLKSEGGQVVAPPSIHYSGGQ